MHIHNNKPSTKNQIDFTTCLTWFVSAEITAIMTTKIRRKIHVNVFDFSGRAIQV